MNSDCARRPQQETGWPGKQTEIAARFAGRRWRAIRDPRKVDLRARTPRSARFARSRPRSALGLEPASLVVRHGTDPQGIGPRVSVNAACCSPSPTGAPKRRNAIA